MISYRFLDHDEILRINEIDRAEEIFGFYRFNRGELILKEDQVIVNKFDAEELKQIIERQKKLHCEGGKIIAAFYIEELAGVASVEKKKRGVRANYCKMDILYVSRKFRKMGIGKSLLEESKNTATEFGAELLYVSATPSKDTIDFYTENGAVLTNEIDPELYRLEPEDIHLEIDILG